MTPRSYVIVEGESDAAAVRALAALAGLDLRHEHVEVKPAHGVTNFTKLVARYGREHPTPTIRGLYDEAEEHHVARALGLDTGRADLRDAIEGAGFWVCVADLEDELIRAIGTDGVESVLAEHDELKSFRRFQDQPQHRDGATSQQLRRFLGTRATRKIRYGRLLVEALDVDHAPLPLRRVLGLA